MTTTLDNYLQQAREQSKSLPEARLQVLAPFKSYVQRMQSEQQPIHLNFICTHNSRRSHLAQIWSAIAAARSGLQEVYCYSGGTEATAFNPRAVAALHRAGLQVENTQPGSANPVYRVSISGGQDLHCFSKRYDDAANPATNFAAVMTCAQADADCPFIPGAAARFALDYRDPKEADDTPDERARYDERCLQIAAEMLYVFGS